jgi:hypothetical protein
MRSSVSWLAALALLLLPAVSGAKDKPRKPKEGEAKGTEVVKEGKVRVVRGLRGGEPQITDEKGKRWLIVGPLRGEAVRLNGHRLKVWAVVGDKKLMMPTLTVNRYEMLESGGRQPLVGILRRETKDKQRLLLERKEESLHVQASKPFLRRLARKVNCKVWLTGDLEGTTLKAFKYGWINCKLPKEIKPRKETTK